jgi:hypothetical protein
MYMYRKVLTKFVDILSQYKEASDELGRLGCIPGSEDSYCKTLRIMEKMESQTAQLGDIIIQERDRVSRLPLGEANTEEIVGELIRRGAVLK